MSEEKSSHEGSGGRQKVSYDTESKASVVGIGSIETIGGGGVISSEEVIAATGGRRSYGNGGIAGSPKVTQRYIQRSYGSVDGLCVHILSIIS